MLNVKKQPNIYYYFVSKYPAQTAMVVCAFIFAAIAEMIGIGIVLPVITTVIDGEQSTSNILSQYTHKLFSIMGIKNDLETMLIFMVCAIIIKSIIIFITMRYVSFVATDISRDLRSNLINSLMSAKWSYYSSIPIGKISNILSNEGQRAGNCYLLAGKTLSSLFQLSVYFIATLMVSWQISLVAMLLGASLLFALKAVVRMARSSGQEMSASLNQLLSRMSDSLTGVKPIKSMGEEARFTKMLNKDTGIILLAQRKQYISNQLLQVIYEPAMIIVMSIGLYLMINYSNIPIPEILLLAFLFHRLMNYANLSQNNYQNTIQNESAVWELKNQINEAENNAEYKKQGGVEAHLNKLIAIKGINISYGGNSVIDQFSCNIYANKINLFFGPSGVGKSSIIDTITGINVADSGSIYIDDTNILDINMQLWRGKIGYVPQEIILLHDSIKNNITFGSDKYSDEDISNVLDQCGLSEFINSLPEKTNSCVGERGTALSGGQRQRVALARALIRKPSILIMDEATTGLDKDSEKLIIETIKKLAGSVTIVMISHDPHIKDIADNIINVSKN